MDINRGYWRDWLPPMCRSWARQRWRVEGAGRMVKNADGTESWHFDGWPITTILGKIKVERDGASHGVTGQHFAEVYSGDGMLVWRAMDGMRFEARCVFYANYLFRASHRDRMTVLGYAKTNYWSLYDESHVWIASGISRISAYEHSEDRTAP